MKDNMEPRYSKNSFKMLEEEMLMEKPHAPSEIESSIKSRFNSVKLTGDIANLYLVRVIKLIISMLGGDQEGGQRPIEKMDN